jgi:antitoxin (DNA-binding transcriptional repressor) of toxin-antitoxin stability system
MPQTATPVDSAQLYTMRELNQRTADVIREINEAGKPALITRHGQFVALITPLANESVESAVIGAVLEHAKNRAQLTGEQSSGVGLDVGEAARDLGVELG